MLSPNNTYEVDVKQGWTQAKRKAFWSQIGAAVQRRDNTLVNFDEIAARLKLRHYLYRGLQNIPLKKIIGSVGRYQDFLRHFQPKTTSKEMRERWEGVARLYLNPLSKGIPPIEVYQVGDSYFVKDGNHRVSVANTLGLGDIEAYVWEYQLGDGIQATGADLDHLFLEAERVDFYKSTQLQTLFPHADITLTLPGGYLDMLNQIGEYCVVLEKVDGQPIAYEYGVRAWYEMRYEVIVQIIERYDLLGLFAGRTLADLYVFTMRQHRQLEEKHQSSIRMTQAIEAVQLSQKGLLQRLIARLKGILGNQP